MERIGEILGVVPAALMARIDEALRLHLALQQAAATVSPPAAC